MAGIHTTGGLAARVGPTRVSREPDAVGIYLEEIGRTPLLTAVQEVDLARRIEAGLYARHLLGSDRVPEGVTPRELHRIVREGEEAKDQFVRANLRLVVAIARRYVRTQMPAADLIQEGNTGVIRAVEKFDYTKGWKFSTYATWWIRQAITRAIAQQERSVRLPVHLTEEVNKVRAAMRELGKLGIDDPDPSDIADLLDMEVARVEDLLRWSQTVASLDAPVGGDSDETTTLGDMVAVSPAPSPEQLVLEDLDRKCLLDLLGCLDPRSAGIIRARYGLDDGQERSLTEVGQMFELSRERIRQLELRALDALRERAARYSELVSV